MAVIQSMAAFFYDFRNLDNNNNKTLSIIILLQFEKFGVI